MPTIPSGPPRDICGYDEHQRMMAWKIPTGIAIILAGIALGFFFEGSLDLANWNGKDGLFIMFVLAGILIGPGLLFGPALMAPDPSNFEPEGTPTMWFWLAWPAGGLLCGIVALLWEAFKKSE